MRYSVKKCFASRYASDTVELYREIRNTHTYLIMLSNLSRNAHQIIIINKFVLSFNTFDLVSHHGCMDSKINTHV